MTVKESVFFYLLVFGISVGMCAFFQKKFERIVIKEKMAFIDFVKLFFIISIIVLPLSLVAAFRGDSVGVDTANYLKIYYNNAGIFNSYWKLYEFIGESPIFVKFVWDAYHSFNSPVYYMFMSQYITAGAIVVYGVMNIEKYPVWRGLCVYCLWFFNDSLNATRQFVAIAIMLVAYQLLECKQVKWAICVFLISLGFHRSVVLIIPVLLFLQFFKFEDSAIKRNSVLLIILFVLLWGQKSFELLINNGILPTRYNLYINTFFYRNSRGVGSWILHGVSKYALFEIFVRVCIVCFYLIIYHYVNNKDSKEFYKYVYILLFDILIYSVGVYVYKTVYFIRLSAFFDFFVINLIPMLEQRICISYKKIRLKLLVVAFSLAYWGVHVVYYGSGATIPFCFR